MFINKNQVKKFALQLSQQKKRGKFTRVSAELYEFLEFHVKRLIISTVVNHPTRGKTIFPPVRIGKDEKLLDS